MIEIDQLVQFNVGGKTYQTSKKMGFKYPNLISKVLSLENQKPFQDSNGIVFFDRPSKVFDKIYEVYQLQKDTIYLKKGSDMKSVIENELEYFGISKYIKVKEIEEEIIMKETENFINNKKVPVIQKSMNESTYNFDFSVGMLFVLLFYAWLIIRE